LQQLCQGPNRPRFFCKNGFTTHAGTFTIVYKPNFSERLEIAGFLIVFRCFFTQLIFGPDQPDPDMHNLTAMCLIHAHKRSRKTGSITDHNHLLQDLGDAYEYIVEVRTQNGPSLNS